MNIHSIHPTNPQESDLIYAIIVTNSGDRIFLESIFEPGSFKSPVPPNLQKSSPSIKVKYPIPITMKVKGFKRSVMNHKNFGGDSEDKVIHSSSLSSGVTIQTMVNRDDSFYIPETLEDDSIFALSSTIFASCTDQTIIAKNLSNNTIPYGSNKQVPLSPFFSEWQYSFSDPNLGLVLNIQENNVPSKFQRLFGNLWNTPNPFSNKGSNQMLYLRPNISASTFEQLLNGNLGSLEVAGSKTSGSNFFCLWRNFFNKVDSKQTSISKSKDDSKSLKIPYHHLIQKYLNSTRSCSSLGIVFPQSPPNGLNDLILDQVTQSRSWTIVTTKGIFILEKKKLLDIITKISLEPQNYSFMLNMFEDQDDIISGTGLSIEGTRENLSTNIQSNSIFFVMKLLGTFAQTITFEQFFALLWQGLLRLNAKGILDPDIIQRIYTCEVKTNKQGGCHVRK
ncbi:large protein with possible domain of nucleoporin [Cryptosporidium felis]|nr:large protein with possible domain of nucleoporin [Cryptosporidium felis]